MIRARMRCDRGWVMPLIIVGLLVGMIVTLVSLMTSRTSIKLSADFRGKTSLYYKAEEGINKTLARFINDPALGEDSSQGGFDPYTGPITCDTDKNPVKPAGESEQGDSDSIVCDFDVGQHPDDKHKLQVMVGRRPDHCKNGANLASYSPIKTDCSDPAVNDSKDGQVYLVNSIATDKTGRQEVAQGVIIIPFMRTLVYNSTSGQFEANEIKHPYLQPYLAALVRGGTHKAQTPAP